MQSILAFGVLAGTIAMGYYAADWNRREPTNVTAPSGAAAVRV